MKSVLLATGDQETQEGIRKFLKEEYQIDSTETQEETLRKIQKKRYELAFVDVDLFPPLEETANKETFKARLQPLLQSYPTVPIIVLASQKRIREAVQFVRAGAADYLNYPIDPEEVRLVIKSSYETIREGLEIDYLRDEFWKEEAQEIIRTQNKTMKEVFNKLKSVAITKATVLLVGETGTGKSLLSKIIHQHSHRAEKPFISIHCGAIPENLVESELFGHEKGAFTGADRRKLGKFEIANGGTIFLDEVSTMPMGAQVKLLNVLQDRIFQRVGGNEDIQVDVRVITATNVDLKNLSEKGTFRSDLFYRLNVFPVEVPPLRVRIEDVVPLVKLFLNRLNKVYPKNILSVSSKVQEALTHYSWPGNIRELENLIERAYILEPSKTLTEESFSSDLFTYQTTGLPVSLEGSPTLGDVRDQAVQNVERRYLRELLAAHRGRIAPTAEAAGISTRQLHKLLLKYEIRKEGFKFLPPTNS